MAQEVIEVDFEELKNAHQGLEAARSDIAGISLELPEGQSSWTPLTLLRETAADLIKLVKEYEQLLWKDSDKLLAASKTTVDQDKESARKFRDYYDSIDDSLRPDED